MGGSDGDPGDIGENKQLTAYKEEKWWELTIQVAIPFFIAGIGTIGAGIILGYVEVSFQSILDDSIDFESCEVAT